MRVALAQMRLGRHQKFFDGLKLAFPPQPIANPENGKGITVNALVDSVASMSFVNIDLAEDLGIDRAATPQGSVSSVNKDDVVYYHNLRMHVQKDTHEFIIPCGFMDFRTDAVVGQSGFFEHYRVVFERYRKTFELTYHE